MQVIMIGNATITGHNHGPQTDQRHRKEENQLSLPQRDECKTRKDTKHCITKQEPNTHKNNWSNTRYI